MTPSNYYIKDNDNTHPPTFICSTLIINLLQMHHLERGRKGWIVARSGHAEHCRCSIGSERHDDDGIGIVVSIRMLGFPRCESKAKKEREMI